MGGLTRLSRHTANDVYSILREEILSLHFRPGQIISENEIAGRFHISRTPVHSAFAQLKSERLIDVIPQKGTVVSRMDLDFIRQVAYMRTQVETAVFAEVAHGRTEQLLEKLKQNLCQQRELAQSGDPKEFYVVSSEYHGIYYDFTGKMKLWGAIENLQFDYTRYRMLFYSDKQNRQKSTGEHEDLYHMIQERDTAGVLRLVPHHLRIDIKGDQETLEQFSDYFLD